MDGDNLETTMESGYKEERIVVNQLRIFVRSWRPAAKPRGAVVICHGFNSHSGHYSWVAEQLVAGGLAAYAADLRGRGKSEGARFYIENIADYVSNLEAVVQLAKSRERGLPVFLLGHSAGGVVSCTYAIEHPADLAGLICESFAFRAPAPRFALAFIKLLSHILPRLRVLKLKNRDFSRDPNVVRAMNSDPLIANEAQPTATVAALVRANERLAREFQGIKVPVFILHGTVDKATVSSGSQVFYDEVGSRDKALKFYEGYFHDLLNDIGKETVMADITRWIDTRLPMATAMQRTTVSMTA